MILDTDDYFSFGNGIPANQRKRKSASETEAKEYLGPFAKRNQARRDFTEFYRQQNIKYRKPCSYCQTLVRPELLHQHYDAYHPGVTFPQA